MHTRCLQHTNQATRPRHASELRFFARSWLLFNLWVLGNSALAATPEQLLYLKAYLNAKRGNHPAAINYFNELIKIKPGCVRAYKERAFSYQKLGKFDRSIADIGAALRLTPKDPDLYCDRGIVYYMIGKNEKAFSDFNAAIKLNGQDARFRNWRANIFVGRQQYQQALADCNAGVSADAQYVRIYRTRAQAYDGLGKHTLAEKDRATYKALAEKSATRTFGRID